MSEWKEYKLGDLADLITKGTTPSSLGGGFVDSGVNFIKSEAVGYDGRLDRSTFVHITEQMHQKLKRSQLAKDDILYSMAGVFLGKNALVPEDVLPANTNQALAIIRLNQEKADPKFIHYYLRQPVVIDFVNNMSGQSAQPNINFEEIRSIAIKLPDLTEQKGLANILSSLDDKIDLLHLQNKTLEQMAEAMFREWFGEMENNGSISQLVTIQNGYAFKSSDFQESGINSIVKIKNISDQIIDIDNTDFISDSIARKIHERFKIVSGDILIAMTGAEIGKLGIIPQTPKTLWLNQRVGLLREKFQGAKYLAYLQLKSEFGQDYIENAATGSAQPNISNVSIENCGFPISDYAFMIDCASKVADLYEKIIFNLGKMQSLSKMRDALLPKLMSGEVKIN